MSFRGETYPATPAGFADLITDANIRVTEGYRLVTVVQITKGVLGVIYETIEPPAPAPAERGVPFSSFFDD